MPHIISITFRPGHELKSWLSSSSEGNSVSSARKPNEFILRFYEFLEKNATDYVVSLELIKNDPKTEHLQCGIITEMRMDNVNRAIKTLYKKFCNPNEYQLKYALKCKLHHDADILFSYCLKDDNLQKYKFTTIDYNQVKFQQLVFKDKEYYDTILDYLMSIGQITPPTYCIFNTPYENTKEKLYKYCINNRQDIVQDPYSIV